MHTRSQVTTLLQDIELEDSGSIKTSIEGMTPTDQVVSTTCWTSPPFQRLFVRRDERTMLCVVVVVLLAASTIEAQELPGQLLHDRPRCPC